MAKFVGVLVEAMDVEVRGDTRFLEESRQGGRLVHTIFSYVMVRSLLAACDGQQSTGIDMDGVITRQ